MPEEKAIITIEIDNLLGSRKINNVVCELV